MSSNPISSSRFISLPSCASFAPRAPLSRLFANRSRFFLFGTVIEKIRRSCRERGSHFATQLCPLKQLLQPRSQHWPAHGRKDHSSLKSPFPIATSLFLSACFTLRLARHLV